MASPATFTDLFERILRSGLLPEGTIAQARIPFDAPPVEAARILVKNRYLTPFQAKTLLTGEARSFFLTQRYKLLEHLGRGGMGDVYLAEHLLLRRVVAIKIILTTGYENDKLATPGAIERFFREARAVATLDHPNVVRVFDMDRTAIGPCLVMEYVDGTNLHSLIKKFGPMPVARAVDATRQAAAGLEHAHRARLIHRDVKPGNLLLDRMGTVKVVDLGLARHKDAALNDGLTGMYDDNRVIGTAGFQAPEQGLDSGNADARSDVYSLGASLYFLLTGQVPFPAGSISNILLAHQIKPPPHATELNPEVPEELSHVIERMMAKRPADRPQTMEMTWAELEPWAEESLPPPSIAEMPKHPPSAYRLGLCPPPTDSMPQVTKLFNEERPSNGLASRSHITMPVGAADTPQSYRTRGDDSLSKPPKSRSARQVIPDSDEDLAPVQLLDDEKSSGGTISAALLKPLSRRTLLLGIGGGLVASAVSGGAYWYLSGSGRRVVPIDPSGGPITTPPTTPAAVPTKPTRLSGLVINGSGSSFVKRAMDRWADKHLEKTGVQIKYLSTGSEKGVSSFMDGTSDFGCTEAFLSDEQTKKAEAVHIPLALGAVVPTYNLPGLVTKKGLNFTGQVLANIFAGEIKRWNDDAIASCNPDIKLPDLPIKVVVRKDGSGTTAVFTEYLSKASPLAFAKKVGHGTTVNWPKELVGLTLAIKNDGIASAVNQTEGALGYVELIYAKEKLLKSGHVQNQGGRYIEPDVKSVTAAAAALRVLPDDLRFSLTDMLGDSSYPIVGCAWAVFHARLTDLKSGMELVEFFRWVTHEGQEMLANYHYAPLPAQWIPVIDKQLSSVTV